MMLNNQPEKAITEIALGAITNLEFTRRDWWFLSIAAASALFGAANLGIATSRIWSETSQKNKEQRELAFRLLFGNSATQFYKTSTNNPYSLITGTTPPTRDALGSILSHFRDHETQLEDMPNNQVASSIDGSLILLGGPVANMYSRQIFGIGQGSFLFGRACGHRVDLPIYFENIDGLTTGPGSRPEYRVIVNGRSLPIYGRGTADQNYLVITSIPNVFSPNYGNFDHRIVIISGLNGVGTRAIHNVLNNSSLMDKLNNKTRECTAWQALVRVSEIDKDKQRPITLGESNVFRIDNVDFDKVRAKVEGDCFWINPNDPLIET